MSRMQNVLTRVARQAFSMHLRSISVGVKSDLRYLFTFPLQVVSFVLIEWCETEMCSFHCKKNKGV